MLLNLHGDGKKIVGVDEGEMDLSLVITGGMDYAAAVARI